METQRELGIAHWNFIPHDHFYLLCIYVSLPIQCPVPRQILLYLFMVRIRYLKLCIISKCSFIVSALVHKVYLDITQSNYTVNMGEEITFYCVASGIPPPSITWYRNGTELNGASVIINDTSDPTTVMDDNGEIITYYINRTLTLRMSEEGDSGSYECSASNEAIPGYDSMAFELIVQSKFQYDSHSFTYSNYSSLQSPQIHL